MKTKIQKWQEISREVVFQKYGRNVEKVIYRLPDGSESDLYIKAEGRAVCILALTKDNRVILVSQFRPGPNEILSELPGGFARDDEELIVAARKELLEETGYTGDLKLIATCFNDAYSTMKKYCFVATDCRKIEEVDNSIADDYGSDKGHVEIKKVVDLSLDDFRRLLQSGKMTDVEAGYLGLDYLKRL